MKTGFGVPRFGAGGGRLSLKLRIREKILGLLRFGCAGAKEVGGVGGGGGSISYNGPWGLGVYPGLAKVYGL